MFPLAGPLSSPASAAAALFGGFAGTTGPSDFPRSFISGLPPWRSLSGPPGDHPTGERGISRFSRLEVPCMPWFFDRAGPTSDSHNAADRVAFQPELRCRHPEPLISRLNSPAYTCPCQRFACTLAGTDA